MSQAAPAITRSPAEVVRLTPVSQAPNGICYAVAGEVAVNSFDLERMIAAVPTKVAGSIACLEEQYSKVVRRKSGPAVTDIA